jgi:hypothetical protein
MVSSEPDGPDSTLAVTGLPKDSKEFLL